MLHELFNTKTALAFLTGYVALGIFALVQTNPVEMLLNKPSLDLLLSWYATMAASSFLGGGVGVSLWYLWQIDDHLINNPNR